MFEVFGLNKTSASRPAQQLLRILYLGVVLSFLIGAVGQTAPAAAASTQDTI